MLQHNQMVDTEDLKSADEESERIMWLTEDELKLLLIMIEKNTG